jgi:hypothetical protein
MGELDVARVARVFDTELEEFFNTSGVLSNAHRVKVLMEDRASHGAAAQPGRYLSSHGFQSVEPTDARMNPPSPVRGDTLIRFMLQFHKNTF